MTCPPRGYRNHPDHCHHQRMFCGGRRCRECGWQPVEELRNALRARFRAAPQPLNRDQIVQAAVEAMNAWESPLPPVRAEVNPNDTTSVIVTIPAQLMPALYGRIELARD
jgi:hypothetical protein